jgi:signal transduction histidine kinase
MDPGVAADDTAAGVRTAAVRCGRGFSAEFRAPIRAGGTRAGTVVLVAPVDDSTFRPLNVSRPGVRTLRTSVLAPLARSAREGASDTLAVVASLGTPGSPEPRPFVAPLPPHVRRALAAPPGRLAIDTGVGLHGALTHYAVVPVPELDWLILREFDRAEVLAAARRALLVEEPILVTLLVSLVALGRHRLQARRTRRAQELTRLRADFVASTSHELRTPLAQIRMFAELLQKDGLRGAEESARALRIIEKEASRLTILVDNLLNYTRLRRRAEDAAALEEIAPADVADDVRHVIDAFAPLAAERGARVVADVPPGLWARVDSAALRQVLINYLENAVKYGPRGQTVAVGAAADERTVRVWVDDEGTGVAADERDAVWEAFRRGRHAEASGQGGSGIGLAVVRELALHYGGGVAVERARARGALRRRVPARAGRGRPAHGGDKRLHHIGAALKDGGGRVPRVGDRCRAARGGAAYRLHSVPRPCAPPPRATPRTALPACCPSSRSRSGARGCERGRAPWPCPRARCSPACPPAHCPSRGTTTSRSWWGRAAAPWWSRAACFAVCFAACRAASTRPRSGAAGSRPTAHSGPGVRSRRCRTREPGQTWSRRQTPSS